MSRKKPYVNWHFRILKWHILPCMWHWSDNLGENIDVDWHSFLFYRTSRDIVDLKLNIKWNLSSIHTALPPPRPPPNGLDPTIVWQFCHRPHMTTYKLMWTEAWPNLRKLTTIKCSWQSQIHTTWGLTARPSVNIASNPDIHSIPSHHSEISKFENAQSPAKLCYCNLFLANGELLHAPLVWSHEDEIPLFSRCK